MNKIKIISQYIAGIGEHDLFQKAIDRWIKEENPDIISTSLTNTENRAYISIVYRDKPETESMTALLS